MSFSNAAENAVLALIFNATAWANVADNAASSPFTNIYVSGHTADPGDGGTQASSELSTGGYARAALPRSTSGWTAPSGGSTSNAAAVSLGVCSSGSATLNYIGLGWTSSGAGALIGSGPVDTPFAVSTGIEPYADIGDITVTLD